MNEITVIRAGALGDVVLALPAVAALRAAFPQARIRAIGYPANWAVAGALIDDVRSIDSAAMAGLLTNGSTDSLHEILGSSDLAVAWTAHDPTSVLRRAGVGHVIHAPPTPPAGVHAAHWLLQSVSRFHREGNDAPGRSVNPLLWRIPYTESELQEGRAVLDELGLSGAVLMHPGAGAAWKRWPAARFASTGMALKRRSIRVALLQGPADEECIKAVQHHAAAPFPVIPPMEARVLGAMLSPAPCYLGNDSGATHLAGTSGTPTVALFGPTDPVNWMPLGQSTILRHCSTLARTGSDIRVCDDPDCLHAITVDEVVGAIDRVVVQKGVENCEQPR